MPNPGAPAPPCLPIEDSYLELLAETLEGLDLPARGQFLQQYFRTTAHLELREEQCLELWDSSLARRRDLSASLARPVAFRTALLDVLVSAGLLRLPILIEYDDLKKLQVTAATDPLTGLHNRRLFTETFEKELNRARRYSLPLGLVILDLHRFKEVNDRHGHPRGDEVLRAAAATLKKALRTSDAAFRIGGDEFALLLPQTDADQALALSRRIETVFAETLQPLKLSVGVSMDHGIATFPQDAESLDQLIHLADERLYRLKHANHGKTDGTPQPGSPDPELSSTQEVSATPPPISTQPLDEPEDASSPAEKPTTSPVADRPAPISIESKRPIEKPAEKLAEKSAENDHSPLSAAASATAADISVKQTSAESAAPHKYVIQRKAERVSMGGTNAYAVLGEAGVRRARVLDLGFGGVAIELDDADELPPNILAVLHVPILPPVRVSLKPVWSHRTTRGGYRVGCAFIS